MRQLGKYSTGHHEGAGWITSHLQGRTVEALMIDGEFLILRFTDGHEAKIGWQDKSGNKLMGEPYLQRLDVRIFISGAGLSGIAGNT